ncbi:MAG TPA: glycosyltransferase [Patescibacteria group bacterium]|nr:glycosyltransferase [Patescibacteria group bacterium]
MGTYPPRECGIATFNQDLLNSSQKLLGNEIQCKVAAMNFSPLDLFNYPSEVEWIINQNNKKEYKKLALRFNSDSEISGVMIQHEYGIYGGIDGKYILSFIDSYKKPLLVTLHTVLPSPSTHMKDVTERIINRANIIVVLTESSKSILEILYPKSKGKVYVIPHGIHFTAFSTTKKAKQKLKLNEDLSILSTFGLLSRGKGIEYVIKALPELIKTQPKLLYLILGQTHPIVKRDEGESYRNGLIELVTELKLENHVRFYDQYLSLSDLFTFLKATDIYISTSININQAVSGTLSYALGTGRAVVSTEFAQAKEIINKDSGILVPIKDSNAYARALKGLLSDKSELEKKHLNAYKQTRPMLWSNVAQKYSELLKQNILPTINFTHLNNMTDDFGLFQFAKLDKPSKEFGYTLDDNARALVICSWMTSDSYKYSESQILKYLLFIKRCQQDDGSFINYLDYLHKEATTQNSSEDLEDSSARAIWAVSEVMSNKKNTKLLRNIAKDIFLKALPVTRKLKHIRSSAFIIKSLAMVSTAYSEYRDELLALIIEHADLLIKEYKKNSIKSWNWFADYLGYNNAIIPESLLIAGNITHSKIYTEKGKASLTFLINKTFSSNRYIPIGHSFWYKNNRKRSNFDQQPEDPASMIMALSTAHKITNDENYLNLIGISFSWFLGNNSLQIPLYNDQNGGCYDGLHPDRINLNQGAESLVSYLLSRIAISKLNLYNNIDKIVEEHHEN